jgi:predicted O-linked N-acetylglucosamine transferase (SPINDLY family)
MRQRIVAGVDHFVDVAGLSDAQAAARTRSDGIDIAIDLMGFTEGCRPKIFAFRPAPIQVGFLGFPGTMGSDCIDYLIADATVIGRDDRAFYAEKVITLPGSYQVNDNRKPIAATTPTRAEVGLPDDGFVFASFNGLQKLTPEMFGHWMALLREVPASVLWLLRGPDAATAALQAEAGRLGIDAARIVWAEPLPLAEHLARHALADLFLDTFPCNAHTTCSDALWGGLPVLTLSGESFASRVAGSLLKTIGLPELVTSSFDDYRARALALASSPEVLGEVRQRLRRNRETSALFDTPLFARRIESAYQAVAERRRQGLAPDHLEIPA